MDNEENILILELLIKILAEDKELLQKLAQ
jgi:hypothetical protein